MKLVKLGPTSWIKRSQDQEWKYQYMYRYVYSSILPVKYPYFNKFDYPLNCSFHSHSYKIVRWKSTINNKYRCSKSLSNCYFNEILTTEVSLWIQNCHCSFSFYFDHFQIKREIEKDCQSLLNNLHNYTPKEFDLQYFKFATVINSHSCV